MSGSYILDTNIVIRLFANDKRVVSKISDSNTIFIPSIVIGELYYGAFNSRKIQNNISRIDQLIQQVTILNCTSSTSRFYGQVKKELKDKGKPIPENDIWIAALSFEHEVELVSDDKHFSYIKEFNLIKW